MYPSLPAHMLVVKYLYIIFYQQQEILIRHFTYTDHSLKMSMDVLDRETSQEKKVLTLSMNFFHWLMSITRNAKTL